MAGKTGLVPVGTWGLLVGFVGLLVISYAAYQTHESLLALFWGAWR